MSPENAPAWQPALAALQESVRRSPQGPTRELPFADLWQPAAADAVDRLRARAAIALPEAGWESLEDALLHRLCEVGTPSLWEHFNRERDARALLLAHLEDGELPSDAYRRFVARLRADGLEALLAELPVLGRLLGTVVALWAEAASELLHRLSADRASFSQLGVDAAAPLTRISFGHSDPHRRGRSVAVLHFGDVRVVYKPKDLQVDAAFNALLEGLSLKTLKVLPRDGYGWVEFLPHRAAHDLPAFYRSAGRLTALLHVLGATDGHHENLIAHGRDWVLIDTETLLEGQLERLDVEGPAAEPSGLQRAIAESVLSTGLLPTWQFVGQQRLARDVSALGVASPPKARVRREGWKALATDGMMPGLVEAVASPSASLPVGPGDENPFDAHVDDFLAGFRLGALAIIDRREAWLELLSRFEGLSRRVVLRSTHIYFSLLQQLTQPDALVSEAAQAKVLEQLDRPLRLAPHKSELTEIVAAERRQLARLDIPFFSHAIDGVDLELGDGAARVPGLLRHSGLSLARARLAALDAAGVDFQCRLVRGAVQARRAHTPVAPGLKVEAARASPGAERLERARRIATELHGLAVLDAERTPHWLGIDLGADSTTLCFGAVGPSLYGGSAGVALLDAALAAAGRPEAPWQPSRPFTELATLAARSDLEPLRRLWRSTSLGLAGNGGVLLALVELDRLGAEAPPGFESHRALALRLLEGLTESTLGQDLALDLIGGAAGLIGPLLQLGHPHATAWAVKAGHHLLRHQLPEGGWASPQSPRPLTGFSHGAAGMAAALGRLHQRTLDEAFLFAARRALTFERSTFDASRRNWPDLREGAPRFEATWCHGAPGIALSRLCLLGTALGTAELEREVDLALSTTAASEPALDHLCCGALGLTAIVRLASRQLGSSSWAAQADTLEARVLARADQRGGFTVFGTREGSVQLPGFMTGLSGIALALLHDTAAGASVERLLTAGLSS